MVESIGERARRLRESRGLLQIEVAEATGISRSYLSQIESDLRDGTIKVLCALADLYNVSIDYLLRGKEFQDQKPAEPILEIWQSLSDDQKQSLITLFMRPKI